MTKFAGKSKTIAGGLILFINFLMSFFGINYGYQEQVITNMFDGNISVEDIINLAQAILGFGLVVYGRFKATDQITLNPKG